MPWWMANKYSSSSADEKAERVRQARLHDAAVVRRRKRKRGGKK